MEHVMNENVAPREIVEGASYEIIMILCLRHI